jgi:hypothetical protein
MKTIFLTLVALAIMASAVLARDPETLVLRQGQKKTSRASHVTLSFVSVTDDSRCPVDVDCIWAGNAKVHVKVTDPSGFSQMMVMNTTAGPKGDQLNGWAVYLTSLTPAPKSNRKITQRSYTATFTITRLHR